LLDCRTDENTPGKCAKPVPVNTNNHNNNNGKLPLQNLYRDDYDLAADSIKKYRLYLYETRIVQNIEFRIEAMTEGGGLLTTDMLRLNVTCPSFVTVAAPLTYNKAVVLYIGGKSVWS
jgi:hypothetical protein